MWGTLAFSSFYLGGLETSNCFELYIILKLRISSFRMWPYLKMHVWRLFGGFVMQGHKLVITLFSISQMITCLSIVLTLPPIQISLSILSNKYILSMH